MADIRDIRKYLRDERYLGVNYHLTAWADGNVVRLSSILVDGKECLQEADKQGFESLEKAYAHGEDRAKAIVDAEPPG